MFVCLFCVFFARGDVETVMRADRRFAVACKGVIYEHKLVRYLYGYAVQGQDSDDPDDMKKGKT